MKKENQTINNKPVQNRYNNHCLTFEQKFQNQTENPSNYSPPPPKVQRHSTGGNQVKGGNATW